MEKAEHVVTGGIRNSYRKGVTNMKVDRHSKIVELIGKYQIETQEELASYLKEAGYHVTQATVSRDIRELKLTKVQKENGRQCYSVMQHQRDFGEKYIRILRDCFVSMDMAQNILVIKTVSGMAMAGGRGFGCDRLPRDRGLCGRRQYHHVRRKDCGRYDSSDG